ncbi:hypothetical protein HRI97_03575 [Treponema socranskii subsp. buccale]|uniref:hypothetical protein n=1 Tax=Treponema socranskii TaxID=53419 RepID=UPI0020A294E6|nr:hypothetical protein [Treponema socranskii]UTD02210.1 hypothetical protein HRI97_03575 [Treponema socranskii subsp. buccale]
MKKIGFNLFSVSAAFCILLSACNFNVNGGKELAEVRVGSAGPQRAADPSTGLPVFDGSNTTITITDASGRILDEGPIPFSTGVTIGVEIVIRATVRTATGTWSKTKSHTVKPGINYIDLELSKTPKGAANLLSSITGKDHSGSNIVSLSTQNGKKLLDGILIGSTKPITARDRLGRIYVLYEDTSASPARNLKRFDVEGNEDTAFEKAIRDALPSGTTIGNIDNIAIDMDDNRIFLFNNQTVYCFKEKEDHSFEFLGYAAFPSGTLTLNVTAAAAYNDVLFVVDGNTLYACGFEFGGEFKSLKFESQATSKPLPKLRSHLKFANYLPECTGLFADDDGVYCLLREQKLIDGNLYALGQLVRYTYSGSDLTEKTKIGLHSKAGTSDPFLAFEAGAFVNPIGFIGYDGDNLYIADDGVNIEYLNENYRINGNKNRIAAFNRKTNTITFNDTEATWYAEYAPYTFPNTKTLLWGKDAKKEFRYWMSADGTEVFSPTNKLFESGLSETPTDIFCYDQDGNLYILWKDSSNYKVRRFALKGDGSYDMQGVDASLTSRTVFAIAVDISDGQNSLYYAYKDGPKGHIEKYSWNVGAPFSSATSIMGYDVPFNAYTAPVTALAANKDGLFAGVKETYQHGLIDKYRLKVQKYKKSDGTPDGELTLVDNAPVYTDASGTPIDYWSFSGNIRIHYGEAINDLKVFDGVLYALSSKSCKIQKFPAYFTDAFKNSGILYKIGSTNDSLSGNAVVLAKKDWNDTTKIGYGFYRFIAVKYDEAERIKLIIASDGAWGEGGLPLGSSPDVLKNTDRVLEYDLKGSLQAERETGGSFSKTLEHGSGFEWQ